MDATQQIENPFSDDEDDDDDDKVQAEDAPGGKPIAILKVFKNNHFPETEFPLFLGENVLGRDPACSVLLPARSVSSRHAVISISALRSSSHRSEDVEVLVWDMASMNGTRKSRLKLTPHVRYALTEKDSLVLADIPCHYVTCPMSPAHGARESVCEENKSLANRNSDGWSMWNTEASSSMAEAPFSARCEKPEVLMVSESDSGSDGERDSDGLEDLVSDSAASSCLSSPTHSSIPTSAATVIPESEDERSISPSSSLQTPDLHSNSKSGLLVLNMSSDTNVEEEETEGNPKETRKVQSPEASPDLPSDSDTDAEEEEQIKSNSKAQNPENPEKSLSGDLHMDSDTDVEEAEEINQSHQSATHQMDSDTDVEKERNQSGSAAALHMDSDTEEEGDHEDVQSNLQTDEASKLEPADVEDFQMDSDTDLEEENGEMNPAVSADLRMISDSDDEEESIRPTDAEVHAEYCTAVGSVTVADNIEPDGENNKPNTTEVIPEREPEAPPSENFHMDSDTDVEDAEDVEVLFPADGTSLTFNGENEAKEETKDQEPLTAEQLPENLKSASSREDQPDLQEATDALADDKEDLEATQAYGVTGGLTKGSSRAVLDMDLEATQAFGATKEDEEQPLKHPNLASMETQLILDCDHDMVADHDKDEEMLDHTSLSTADTLIIASTPNHIQQTPHFSLFTAETQLVWEEDGKPSHQSEPAHSPDADAFSETLEENDKLIGGGSVHRDQNVSDLVIAETQPMCEEEEREDFSSESPREKQATFDTRSGELSSPRFALQETQPICEEEERENISSPRETQTTLHSDTRAGEMSSSCVVLQETQPLCEEAALQDVEKPFALPEKPSSLQLTIAETQMMIHVEEDNPCSTLIEEAQPVGEEDNNEQPGVSSSSKGGTRIPQEKENVQPNVCFSFTDAPPLLVDEKMGEDLDHTSVEPEELSISHLTATEHKPEEHGEQEEEISIGNLSSTRNPKKVLKKAAQSCNVPVGHQMSETASLEKQSNETNDGNGQVTNRRSSQGITNTDAQTSTAAQSAVTTLPNVTKTREKNVKEEQGVRPRRSCRARQTTDTENVLPTRRRHESPEESMTAVNRKGSETSAKTKAGKRNMISGEESDGAKPAKRGTRRTYGKKEALAQREGTAEPEENRQERNEVTPKTETEQKEELQGKSKEDTVIEVKEPFEDKEAEMIEAQAESFPAPVGPSGSQRGSPPRLLSLEQASSQRGRGRGRGRGRARGRLTINQSAVVKQSPARGSDDEEQSNSASCSSRSSEKAGSLPSAEDSVPLQGSQTKSSGRGRGRGRGRGGRRSAVENTSDSIEEPPADTSTTSRGRKRAATTPSSAEESSTPAPKTSRRSTSGQTHKVLFTGLTDEGGERVVTRLGGHLAKGVNDMTHLVTDKARRTVKFLCAVARGVPIVTPDWLKKCGVAGRFLPADDNLLHDSELEKKFSFRLQDSLQTARTQPLLQGYEVHVTSSVMPEPPQMKEIISCCGGRFLAKLPSSHRERTVVVSCEQDRVSCEEAARLSLPVVSAEFLLTGILQQKVDLQAHMLHTSPQSTAPKAPARARRK